MIRDQVEVILSSPMPPYSSGISTAVNPSSAALRISAAITPGSLALDLVGGGQNLLARKPRRRRRDLPLLLVQILGREYLCGSATLSRKLPPAAATIGKPATVDMRS